MGNAITRPQAEAVRKFVAAHFGLEESDFFLADHTHEGLSPGAWSLAMEGWDDWSLRISALQWQEGSGVPQDVFLEPIASWCLGIYPKQ